MAVETNPGPKSKLPVRTDEDIKISASAMEIKETAELEDVSDTELPDTQSQGSGSTRSSSRGVIPKRAVVARIQALDSEVQVPSSAPPSAQLQKIKQSHTQHKKLPEETEEPEQSPDDSDLAAFDWDDLSKRYQKELDAIDQSEDEIVGEFQKWANAFVVWAEAKSMEDNTRSLKRLKTRERHVRISEGDLQEKKNHHAEVVIAFQKALALLRR